LISHIYKPYSIPKYKVGIIPHINDYDFILSIINNDKIIIIDLKTENIENVIEQINSCNLIISSSLHGIITSHSYGIPALWFRFGNSIGGDDIKFYDYYYSVGIHNPISFSFTSCCINKTDEINALYKENKTIAYPEQNIINLRCSQLLTTAPFLINSKYTKLIY
jgi:pyruvyltransferase